MHFKSLSPNQLFNWLTVALAFSIPLSIGAYTLISALLAIVWVWEGDWRIKWKMIREQKVFWFISLFFLYYALTLTWSDHVAEGLSYLRKFYFFLLLPMFYTSLRSDYLASILKAFLAAMIISEVLSYLIFFELMPFQYKPTWSPADPSPFMSRGMYSFFLSFTVLLMVINLFEKRHTPLHTAIYLLFIITMLSNLFMNAGRTGQIAVIGGSIIYLLTYFKFNLLKTFSILTPIIATVFFLAYQMSPNFNQRSLETINSIAYMTANGTPLSDDSTGQRVMIWEVGMSIVNENPWFGIGLGDHTDVYQTVITNNFSSYPSFMSGFTDFHNTYLHITVNGGILALLLWLLLLWSFATSLTFESKYRSIGAIMLGLLALYMMIGNLPASYLTILFVLIMGITLKRPSDDFRNSVVQ